MNRLLLRAEARREDGNAMIFALLVLFVCVSIAAIVAALALTNSLTSKSINGSLAYQAGTDTALANALQVANTPAPNGGYNVLYSHQGKANAVTGQVTAASSSYPVKWRWYTTRVSATGGQAISWYIYADAYQSSPDEYSARHVRQTFTPLVTVQGTRDATNNYVTYQGDLGSAFQYGLLGTTGVTLADGVTVYSYDSTVTLNPGSTSGAARVATNQVLTLGANTGVNRFIAFRGATCTPAANCPPTSTSVQQENPPFRYGLGGITAKVASSCPNAAASYPTWTASTSQPLVDGGCYNTLTFDTGANFLNPTRVYVKGNVTVSAGAKVNTQNSPENLQIYSQAGSSASFQNGSAANPTVFNGVLAGEGLACSDTATTAASPATLSIYGGLACSRVNLGPATTIWLDAAATNATPSRNVSTIYQPIEYQVYN